jgi:YjbE family integral membrane protein
MILGAGAAVGLRIIFAFFISLLLGVPWLKIVGGLALLWIAVKLLVPDENDGSSVESSDSLWRAVKLNALADVVMSLDNVIAVAAAAKGNYALLVFGLGISVPAIIAGATVIMAMLNYFPMLIWAGAALLGWIAGDVIATDPIVVENVDSFAEGHHEKIRLASSLLGTVGTLICGRLLRARHAKESA